MSNLDSYGPTQTEIVWLSRQKEYIITTIEETDPDDFETLESLNSDLFEIEAEIQAEIKWG